MFRRPGRAGRNEITPDNAGTSQARLARFGPPCYNRPGGEARRRLRDVRRASGDGLRPQTKYGNFILIRLYLLAFNKN